MIQASIDLSPLNVAKEQAYPYDTLLYGPADSRASHSACRSAAAIGTLHGGCFML